MSKQPDIAGMIVGLILLDGTRDRSAPIVHRSTIPVPLAIDGSNAIFSRRRMVHADARGFTAT
jgi:hypothetical protein